MEGINSLALERLFPVLAAEPAQDINASAITGDYANFSKFHRYLVVVEMKDGTATSGDIAVTLYQATSNAGADAKVLAVLITGRIFTRYAADYATLAALTTAWTKVTQATASETYTDATSGENAGFIALEIRDTDLDADNNFDYFCAEVAAASSSKTVSLIYIGLDPVQGNSPDGMEVPTV